MDLVALKAELDAGHPDTGPYNADDAIASDELNAMNRPADGTVDQMAYYLITERARSNQGTDTVETAILGRLAHLAGSDVGSNPFGRDAGKEVTLEQKHAAQTLLEAVLSPNISNLDFNNTELGAAIDILAGGPGGAQVMKNPDAAALKALSDNRQSRANEIGLGRVREGDVAAARAL